MALLSELTSDQLDAIRAYNGYHALQFVCLVPNTVVVQFQPDAAPSTAVYAEIEVGSVAQGSMSNIKPGQLVIFSATSDYQASEYFRTRVRKVSGTSVLYCGENSQTLTTSNYVTVINTYEIQERLRKSETLVDWDITFRKLLPIETALQSAYVLTNDETSFTPTAIPKRMDFSGTSSFTHAWESSNTNDTLNSGGTTASPDFTLEAAAFRWIRYTFTDSNGNANYRVIPVWTVPKDYSSVVALGFIGQGGDVADITPDAELGWTATVPAWSGISELLNKTYCVIASDEWYDDTRQSIRTNVNFVGYLQNEDNSTQGNEQSGKQSETRFTVESFGHQLARQNIAPIRITRVAGTPTAWNQIQNPTPARMLTYHLTEGSTLFNLCSMSVYDDDTDFVGDDLSITSGKALDDIRFITEVINAELQYDVTGHLDLCRNLNFLDDDARDAADVVATLTMHDMLGFNYDYDYSKTTSSLTMNGGAYISSQDNYRLHEAITPAVARLGEGDPQQVVNQVLTTDSTIAEANDELAQRAANFFAHHNPTYMARGTLKDEWHFLVPDVGSWVCFDIAGTDTARGKEFSAADRWQFVQVTVSTNSQTGRRQVDFVARHETTSTGAMVRAAQIVNDPAADVIYYPAVLAPFVGENLEFTDGNYYDSQDPAPPSDPNPPDADCEIGGFRIRNPIGFDTDGSAGNGELVAVTTRGYGRLTTSVNVNGLVIAATTNPFTGGGGTGANVLAGQSLTFTATGLWDYFPGGAAMNANGDGTFHASAILPSASLGALIGKCGSAGSWFFIGASNTVVMPASGELHLALNDIDAYPDNTGSQTVDIEGDEIYGDSYYFWVTPTMTNPTPYPSGKGLLIENAQPAAIPPPTDTHEYTVNEVVTSGPVALDFDSPYASSGASNWSIQAEVCFTGIFP